MRSPALLLLPLAVSVAAAQADPQRPFRRTEARAPCSHFDPLRSPFFGDLHVHTTYSLDASTQGTRNTPADAYRFARGGRLGLQPYDRAGNPGRSVQLSRPLDFAAVTDHAELFGELEVCRTPGLRGHDSIMCRIYRGWPRVAFFAMNGRDGEAFSFCGPGGTRCDEAARGVWGEIRRAAEAAYDRSSACSFTSFVAYEWTKKANLADNLHRNVIFRNERVPALPASSARARTQEALWEALDRDCRRAVAGCEALAIPHNSNLSGGLMFPPLGPDGAPLDADLARRRREHEPLVEIMQHKGDSECRAGAGTEDELCGFEKLPYDSFGGRFVRGWADPPDASNFTRTALGEGLVQQARIGANPFQFGVIASTDTHLGTPGLVSPVDYPGHGGAGTPVGEALPEGLVDPIEFNPGGIAVLWAEENSRDALFAAMRRREVYGTSGPRIVLRLFGGWELPADLCERGGFAGVGYARGVPMGAELPPRPAGAAGGGPILAGWALQDPGVPGEPGLPLQRLQVVKLWVEDGRARERVIDVAGDPHGSGGVDTPTCEPTGSGFGELCAVWRDPDFDPAAPALYYGRAVENPSCRWSTRACNAAGVDCRDPGSIGPGFEPCCDPATPRTVQDRAWTSPIWYTP